jgi:hypothetical protein
MFLRQTLRKKDGKQHRYWGVVENRRVAGGRVVQKHLLYLGEINDSQELAWRKSIEILDEDCDQRRTLALFPESRCDEVLPDALRDNQNPSSSDNLAYIRWWSSVRWASWCQARSRQRRGPKGPSFTPA